MYKYDIIDEQTTKRTNKLINITIVDKDDNGIYYRLYYNVHRYIKTYIKLTLLRYILINISTLL